MRDMQHNQSRCTENNAMAPCKGKTKPKPPNKEGWLALPEKPPKIWTLDDLPFQTDAGTRL